MSSNPSRARDKCRSRKYPSGAEKARKKQKVAEMEKAMHGSLHRYMSTSSVPAIHEPEFSDSTANIALMEPSPEVSI